MFGRAASLELNVHVLSQMAYGLLAAVPLQIIQVAQ